MAKNVLNRMLVNNGSSINILFGTTYDKMLTSHKFTPMTTSLYGFTGDIIPREGLHQL